MKTNDKNEVQELWREKKETEPLTEVSLFSWLGSMIVLKPSLVSALSLFLWVIKTNKPWDQTKAPEDRAEEDRKDLNIFITTQLGTIGEGKREAGELHRGG